MSKIRIGILGGGQLAQMLCEAESELPISLRVFASSPQEPAALHWPRFTRGDWSNPASLMEFRDLCDVITIENEFIPCELLKSQGFESLLRPHLQTVAQLQNKLTQKKILQRLGIATSPFLEGPLSYKDCQDSPTSDSELEKWLATLPTVFKEGFVVKWSMYGYDGKGTWISPSAAKWSELKSSLHLFAREGLSKGGSLYAEEKIPFRRELAMVACRGSHGEFRNYPLVISQQQDGICRFVAGPAIALGVAPELQTKAIYAARSLAEALDIVGCFAIEFFESQESQLLVNEIAPRVHNSGHYTQEGATTSQFSNHLRAVAGLPLGATDTTSCFAMINLIGPKTCLPATAVRPTLQLPTGATLHWYGKNEIRPGRKMGHINMTSANNTDLQMITDQLRGCAQQWESLVLQSP